MNEPISLDVGKSAVSDLLLTHTGDITVFGLIVNLCLSAILCGLLAWFYLRFGTSLTNRNHLAKNFILVGVTTTLVITVVKSSLALSLGLVGALSIVRFRAAIKEPEELAFIFLAIAIGLGTGADHRVITTIATVLIMSIFLIQRIWTKKASERDSVYLTVSLPGGAGPETDAIVALVERHIPNAKIKRLDRGSEHVDLLFILSIDRYSTLSHLKRELEATFSDVEYTIVEEPRLV